MNTHVNGCIVSTVGEYAPSHVLERGEMRLRRDGDAVEEVGAGRLYETMVFPAVPSGEGCCPFVAVPDAGPLDVAAYNDAVAAFAGHMVMLDKWGSR